VVRDGSVVHIGVKSFGCEDSTAHESPIQSWQLSLPSVVLASKSQTSGSFVMSKATTCGNAIEPSAEAC
jgi:hypothetical protein